MVTCYEFEGVRYLHARHNDGCDGADCSGCQQCGEHHCGTRRGGHNPGCEKDGCDGCRVCGNHLAHGENTCPACISKVRVALREIVGFEIERQLQSEALEKGVDSDAFWLSGPSTNPEAWSWRLATAALDGERLFRNPTVADDEDWSVKRRTRAQAAKDAELLRFDPSVARAEGWSRDRRAAASTWVSDDRHPLYVLRQIVDDIESDYGETYDRSEHIAPMADWIDARLGRLAHDPAQDFSEIRRKVSRCHRHLENVLSAGEQHDTGAPCMKCRVPLRRVRGATEEEDRWLCPKCRETSTDAQYRLVVKHAHRAEAEWLTQEEMQARTGVPCATIRSWALRGQIRKRDDGEGRKVYSVADVEARVKRAAS